MLERQRSAAAMTLPALVPTITSASLSGHGSRSCTAGSAPVIHAAPSTPPAPSTRPIRGPEPAGAWSEPMIASQTRHPACPAGPRGIAPDHRGRGDVPGPTVCETERHSGDGLITKALLSERGSPADSLRNNGRRHL